MLFVSLSICVAYLKGCVLQHLQWEHLNQAPDFPFKSRLSFFPNPIFLLNSSRTTQNMARLTGGTCSSASLPSGAHMSVLSGHLQMGPICQEHNSRCSHRPAWGRCTAVVPRARAARWSFGIQDGSQRGPGSPGHRHFYVSCLPLSMALTARNRPPAWVAMPSYSSCSSDMSDSGSNVSATTSYASAVFSAFLCLLASEHARPPHRRQGRARPPQALGSVRQSWQFGRRGGECLS
jgi:hypothetical protein